jgi:hypothetical protein
VNAQHGLLVEVEHAIFRKGWAFRFGNRWGGIVLQQIRATESGDALGSFFDRRGFIVHGSPALEGRWLETYTLVLST